MADRGAGKAKKQAKKGPARPAKSEIATAAASHRARLSELETECTRLRGELDTVKKRLDELEAQRKQLLDRIDWAIDSLSSLRDS